MTDDTPDNDAGEATDKRAGKRLPLTSDDNAEAAVAHAYLAERPIPKRMVRAWAFWDWGSAAFNAVVTTFVFSTYLASGLFVDPDILAAAGDDSRNPALVAAKAGNATLIGTALTC